MNNVMTKLQYLNLVDKFLFDEVMEDTESCQAVISILLEREIELLTRPETEKELRVSPQLRQVRLDVVSMDSEGVLYYTEMQKRDTGNLRKRSRYYQAQLDVSLLEPGTADFNLLGDSCFILIAPFDIFGRGLYRYTFEGACRECPDLRLGDGAVRVFINTKGTNREEFSQEFLDFMGYVTASTDSLAKATDSSKIKLIHEKVRRVKRSEKMGVKYMQRWEELVYARQEGKAEGIAEGKIEGIAEGRAEGRAAGRAEGKAEGEELHLIRQVCKKLTRGKAPEVIAKELEEDVSVISGICKTAREYAPDYDWEKIWEKRRG